MKSRKGNNLYPFRIASEIQSNWNKSYEITKGWCIRPLMNEKSAAERIIDLLEEHFQRKLFVNTLATNPSLFDLSRPNIHDNKTDFLRERDTVAQVIKHLDGVTELLLRSEEGRSPEHDQMMERLRAAVETNIDRLSNREFNLSASGLAIQNVLETGFFYNSIIIVIQMQKAYIQRLSELKEQELEFWSVNNRPPNYYARAIALRFAKFYAREAGHKPTFGTSRDGPHPSTDYGRLLEEIFAILKIDGDYKRAGQWAVAQVTDDDMTLPMTGLLGMLGGLGNAHPDSNDGNDANSALVEALTKGR